MSLEDALAQFMTRTDAAIRNLEVQVGQISNVINTRPQGSLPSNTVVNPKEQVQAVTLRSGKELDEPVKIHVEQSETQKKVDEPVVEEQVKPTAEPEKPKSKLFPDNPLPYVPPIPFP